MKLNNIPQNVIKELRNLIEAGDIDMNSPAVTNSVFYQRIQNESSLIFNAYLEPAIQLLMIQIAATSPSLHTINMTGNNLGPHGPATAAALATSDTIHTIIIDDNQLREHGPATAAALATSKVIHTVYIDCNDLGKHGPATAKALAASDTIHTVDMETNNLGKYGPATAVALASSNTIHTVDIGYNNLDKHGPATAKALVTSNTIHTIKMCSIKQLDVYRLITATIFKQHNQSSFHGFTDELLKINDELELFPVDIIHLIGEYAAHPYIDFTIE
ncbi:MAG: hypothetical protein AB8B66_02670 [Rickettsiaceae bacterium]